MTMKKYLIAGIIGLAILCGIQVATTQATSCIQAQQGGTGLCSGGTVGQSVIVSSTNPLVLGFGSATGGSGSVTINKITTSTYTLVGSASVVIATSTDASGQGIFTFTASGGSVSSTNVYAGAGISVSQVGVNATVTNIGVLSVNGATGTVLFAIPATTTINGGQYAVFHIIGDGTIVTSTTSGATTTFSIVPGSFLTLASGTALYYPLSSNPSGFISTSTGLTVANFASGNISQWTNNAGYVTSTGAGAVTTSSAPTAFNFPYWANTTGGLSGTSTLFFASSTGNVGIGTTNPNANLDIKGANTIDGLRVALTGQSPYLAEFYNTYYSNTTAVFQYFGYNSGEFRMGTQSTTGVGLYTNGQYFSPQLYLRSGGNVGIGTTAPAETLSINAGSGGFNGTGIKVYTTLSTQAKVIGFDYGGDAANSYTSGIFDDGAFNIFGNGRDIKFLTGASHGTESMRILNSNGNVGIGTTAPSSTLTVNGSFARGLLEVSASSTLTSTSSIVGVIATSTSKIVLTLPSVASVAKGDEITIKDEIGQASSYPINIVGASSQLIDGQSSTTLTSNYQAIQIYSNGSAWYLE